MRNRFMFFCISAVSAGLLILTCSKKSPTGPDDGGTGPTPQTYNFTSTDTTITVSIPEHIDTIRYCVINNLTIEYDTNYAGFVAWSYVISGNTLTLNDTAAYNRSGTGSGLIGSWTLVGTNDNFPSQITFAAATVTLVYQKCYADEFITFDWAPDSANYAVSLQKVSCTQVQLTGDTTHEVVTITWNASGDMTTASSNPAHTPHIWYENPGSCPNNDYPDWYYSEFLNDNFIQFAAAKRAVRPAVLRVKKHSIFR